MESFSLPSFSLSIYSVMGWLCADQSRRVASEEETSTFNASYSCLCSLPVRSSCCAAVMFRLQGIRRRNRNQPSLSPICLCSCKTSSHLTFMGLCNLGAATLCSKERVRRVLLPEVKCRCIVQTRHLTFSSFCPCHGLCVNPTRLYKHPVYTLHHIHPQGSSGFCMASLLLIHVQWFRFSTSVSTFMRCVRPRWAASEPPSSPSLSVQVPTPFTVQNMLNYSLVFE